MKKYFMLFLTVVFFTLTFYAKSQYLSDVLSFQKQGFCKEVMNEKFSGFFPYMIKCKDNGVWGLSSFTIKSEKKENVLLLKNMISEKIQYILIADNYKDLTGFDFIKDKLFISTAFRLYMYKLDDLNKDTMKAELINKYNTENRVYFNKDIKFVNDTLWLLEASSNLLNRKDSTSINLRYIDKNNIMSKTVYIKDPDCVFLSVIEPSDLLDISGAYILTADRLKYNINIYDRKLNKIAGISEKWKDTNYISESGIQRIFSKYDFRKSQSVPIIRTCDDSILGKINILDVVQFLNDSTIIVCREVPLNGGMFDVKYYYDLWKLKNSQWYEDVSGMENFVPEQKGYISANNIPFYKSFVCGYNYFYVNSKAPFIITEKIKYEDYKKKEDQYYLDNSELYGYFIFKYSN